MSYQLLTLPAAATTDGTGVVLEGDGRHEPAVSVHVVGHRHQPLVRQPHVVLPLHSPRRVSLLLLPVVQISLFVLYFVLVLVLQQT